MGNIITNWLVNFGESSANINKTAADVQALNASIEASRAATVEAAKQSAAAITQLNNSIKESAEARKLEQEALKRSKAEADALAKEYEKLKTAGAGSTAEGQARLAKMQQQQRQLKQEIAETTKNIEAETAAINNAKAAIDKQAAAQKQVTDAAKQTEKAQQAAAKAAQQAAKETTGGAKDSTGAAGFLEGAIGKVGVAFGALFAVNKLKQLGGEIIDVTVEFERYGAVLATIFDGNEQKAKRQFALIEDYAARTPFSVNEVTDAYVQLRNRGLDPTEKQLVQLGDLAAASGKGFLQVSEAVLNAQVGIYRNLKQFGVTASVDGEKVRLTFKGVTTELEKGSEALSQYLLNLGATAGISGSTARISDTLGGSISNLKDVITQLFAVIGEGNKGPLSSFVRGTTNLIQAIKSNLEGIDAKAIRASAEAVDKYERDTKARFANIAATAKRQGQDVKLAIDTALLDGLASLDEQLVAAENRARRLRFNPVGGGATADQQAVMKQFFGESMQVLDNKAGGQAFEAARVAAEATVKRLQGFREALAAAAKGEQVANEKTNIQLGLILALKEKIKKLDEKREATSTTKDDLLKKGGLNDQKAELEKELAILEGKEDKAAKDRRSKLEAALKALQAAELDLHKKHGKELEAQAKEDGKRLAQLQLDHDLESIEQLRKTIIEKEQIAKREAAKLTPAERKAAGYTPDQGDGQLSNKQQKEFDGLNGLAHKAYLDRIAALERESAAKILDLQRESNERELAQLTAKFEEEIRIARLAHNKQLVEALQAAQERATALLLQQQALKALDQGEQFASNEAKKAGGEVLGSLPVAEDASLLERISAKVGAARIDTEKNLQRQLLEIALDYNKRRLNAIQEDGTEETRIRRSNLELAISDGEKALGKLKTGTDFTGFLMNILGVKPEDRDEARKAIDDFAATSLQQLQDFAQAQVDATRAVADDAKDRVAEKRSELDTEIALNKEGFASNVETKRAELAEAKRIRAEALKDQKAAQRAQIILDATTQASGLITTSTNILAATSSLGPYGFVIGIAAVAAMLTFFTAAKAKALQAVNAQTLEQGGEVKGRRHSQGGEKYRSEDGNSIVEIEAGEHVTKRRAAQRHRKLLASINAEDENAMIQYLFNDLLRGTGVARASAELPEQMQRAQAGHSAAVLSYSSGSGSRLDQLAQDVAAIRAHTRPQAQVVDTGDAIITTEGNRTRIERKRPQ